MAQQIVCDLCEQETAVLLQTDVETGQVIAVGGSCLFAFYLGAAGGLVDGMAPEVRAEYAANVSALAEAFTGPMGVAGDPSPAARAPRARPGPRKGKRTAVAGTGDASVTGDGITLTPDGGQ
jgi:hypothetical protein